MYTVTIYYYYFCNCLRYAENLLADPYPVNEFVHYITGYETMVWYPCTVTDIFG